MNYLLYAEHSFNARCNIRLGRLAYWSTTEKNLIIRLIKNNLD